MITTTEQQNLNKFYNSINERNLNPHECYEHYTLYNLLLSFPNKEDLKEFFEINDRDQTMEKKTYKCAVLSKEELLAPGIYLMGSTFFNPHTKEEFYWIKVGKSNKMSERMKQHAISNPMYWPIEYCYLPKSWVSYTETHCHTILSKIAVDNCGSEWFCVSRENYLSICEKGFNWFDFISEKAPYEHSREKVL